MLTALHRFFADDDGAVTVDWVVLTAFIAGFGGALAFMIADVATDESASVGAHLATMTIPQF